MQAPDMTLAHLAFDHDGLVFVCPECGASVVAPMDRVLRRFGPQATIDDVRAPVVCKHCGNIDVQVRLSVRALAMSA